MAKKIKSFFDKWMLTDIDPEFFVKPDSFRASSDRINMAFSRGVKAGIINIIKNADPKALEKAMQLYHKKF